MIVEMFEENEYWNFKSSDGLTYMTALPIGSLTPLEVKGSDKTKLKQVIKLKEAGFTADEILELIKEI